MTEPVGPGRALLIVTLVFLTALAAGTAFGLLAAHLSP